jgi:hypothetical protein
MQSQCENIIYGLFQLPEYEEEFPLIKDFKDMSPADLYYAVSVYDKYTFMRFLSKDKNLTDEYIDEVTNKAFSIDTYDKQHMTNMMYALTELVNTDYVKEITVVFDRPIYEHDLRYLTTNFFSTQDKISVSEDSFLDILKDDVYRNKYTTIMSGNIDDLWKVVSNNNKDYICEGKVFILCENTSTIEYEMNERTGKFNVIQLYNKEFASITKFHDIEFGRYKPEPMLFMKEEPEDSCSMNLNPDNIPSMKNKKYNEEE